MAKAKDLIAGQTVVLRAQDTTYEGWIESVSPNSETFFLWVQKVNGVAIEKGTYPKPCIFHENYIIEVK